MINVYKYLFKFIQINISKKEIDDECSHYIANPNFQNISESLAKWNIKSLLISIDNKILEKIPIPAIIKKNNQDVFDILKNINGNNIIVFDTKNKKDKIYTLNEFLKFYSNKLLLIEKIDNVSFKQTKLNPLNYTVFIGLLAILLSIIITLDFTSTNRIDIIIIYLSLILLTSYYLREKGHSNTVFTLICGNNGKSCISKKKNYFLNFSFSEIGIIFFLTILLSNIFLSNDFIPLFKYILYLFGIVILFFSLFLQIFIYNKICLFCLIIAGLFIIDYYFNMNIPITYSLRHNLIYILLLFLSYLEIQSINYIFHLNLKRKSLSNLNKHLWRKKEVINKFSEKTSGLQYKKQNLIEFGSKNASKRCILIISPRCKYCLKAFENLLQLVLLNEEYKLILFVLSEENGSIFQLANASISGDKILASNIIHNWSNFIEKYPNNKDDFELKNIVKSNKEFFTNNFFSEFPIIIIENKIIPNFIEPENIKIAFSK